LLHPASGEAASLKATKTFSIVMACPQPSSATNAIAAIGNSLAAQALATPFLEPLTVTSAPVKAICHQNLMTTSIPQQHKPTTPLAVCSTTT